MVGASSFAACYLKEKADLQSLCDFIYYLIILEISDIAEAGVKEIVFTFFTFSFSGQLG